MHNHYLKNSKNFITKISVDWIHPYKNSNTGKVTGTGFFINDQGYILTCSHVEPLKYILLFQIMERIK